MLGNALYFQEKLTRGTGAFVWSGGLASLEECLGLVGVPGGSGLSVVGGHLGGSEEVYSHPIWLYPRQANGSGERGDQEMEFSFNRSGRKRTGSDIRSLVANNPQRGFQHPATRYLIADYRY